MRALYSENDKIFYYADEKKDKISRNLIDFSLRRHAQGMKYEISVRSCVTCRNKKRRSSRRPCANRMILLCIDDRYVLVGDWG